MNKWACCPCLLPLFGMVMFALRPRFWGYMVLPCATVFVVTVAVIIGVAMFTIEFQVQYIEEFGVEKGLLPREEGTNHTDNSTHDNLMKAATVVLPPVEAAIASLIVFQLLFSKVIDKMMHEVLEDKGTYEKLRERNDWQDIPKVSGPPNCIFMFLTVVVLLASLPLNFVLFIGQILFIFANGWVSTWNTMSAFLPLIGYKSIGSQLKHVLCHPISYLCFGAVTFAFGLIPMGSVITAGGVACGAAMLFGGFVDENRNGPDEIPKSELGYNLIEKANVPAASLPNIRKELEELTEANPHIKDSEHFLNYYVQECMQSIAARDANAAQDFLESLVMELDLEEKKIAEAFVRFDSNRDDKLQGDEIKFMMDYLGFPSQPGDIQNLLVKVDKNHDDVINLEEFLGYVNRTGGSLKLFELRRASQSQGVSHHQSVKSAEKLRSQLNSCGIDATAQIYWRLVCSETELEAAGELIPCQQKAVRHIRTLAKSNHERALPALLERFQNLGFSEYELRMTLAWVREVAPIIVHINLDKVADFLMKDTHYRNQFETKSSSGLLSIPQRKAWEAQLFGNHYNNALAPERPKYGVQNVWNDFQGVMGCKQYGDSYMILKDVRLRTTFSPEDSANLKARRLSVPDFYAHQLLEFSERELKEVVHVAGGGVFGGVGDSQFVIEKWGKYKEAQVHGEVNLNRHVDRLVVNERHRPEKAKIEKLAKAHNWKLTWMDDMQAELQSKTTGTAADQEEWRKRHQAIASPKAGSDMPRPEEPNSWTFAIDKTKVDPTKAKAAEIAAGLTETAKPLLDKGKEHISRAEEMLSKKAPALVPLTGFLKGALDGLDLEKGKGGAAARSSE